MREKKSFSFALLVLWGVSATGARGDQEIPFHPWRCTENGGINVLYCYLRVHGVTREYSNLVREQAEEVGAGAFSAATLARLSAKNGLPLQAVSLTMDELLSCPRPVIVHLDGESPEAGSFLLILSLSEKQMDCVDGATAAIHKMAVEDFRRVWSGIALLPAASRWPDLLLGMIGSSIGVILGVAVRFNRWRNSS